MILSKNPFSTQWEGILNIAWKPSWSIGGSSVLTKLLIRIRNEARSIKSSKSWRRNTYFTFRGNAFLFSARSPDWVLVPYTKTETSDVSHAPPKINHATSCHVVIHATHPSIVVIQIMNPEITPNFWEAMLPSITAFSIFVLWINWVSAISKMRSAAQGRIVLYFSNSDAGGIGPE